jgi:hypothetical protein
MAREGYFHVLDGRYLQGERTVVIIIATKSVEEEAKLYPDLSFFRSFSFQLYGIGTELTSKPDYFFRSGPFFQD